MYCLYRMPNAKCDKCNMMLHEICIKKEEKDVFKRLVAERSIKSFGVIYQITPGIKHYEVVRRKFYEKQVKCDGILHLQPFTQYPNKKDEQMFKDYINPKIIPSTKPWYNICLDCID